MIAQEKGVLARSAFTRYLGDPSVALPQRQGKGNILLRLFLHRKAIDAGGADTIGKCLYNRIESLILENIYIYIFVAGGKTIIFS